MIWSVVSKSEMAGYKIPPVFQYYREVIGKDNIQLAVVDEGDSLDFVNEDDIVLLRTASESIISTIKRKSIKSTAEDFEVYLKARDKAWLSKYMTSMNIKVPRQYSLKDVVDGKTYFVKPRYGSESFGISPKSICKTEEEVIRQVQMISKELNQEAVIEEFIKGVDCTTACHVIPDTDAINAYTIKVECEEVGGIQTHKGKFDYNEYCSSLEGPTGIFANAISRIVMKLLNVRHHARIDFRLSNEGNLYVIDVNLLPGLGPSAHYSKCMLLTENISYADAIKSIINSATR